VHFQAAKFLIPHGDPKQAIYGFRGRSILLIGGGEAAPGRFTLGGWRSKRA
jgi:ATP-dependent exoDNAse (exonuclease V) beta subunit